MLRETRRRGPRGHRGRPATSPTRSSATPRSSTRSTSPWSAPARPAACSRSRSSASPTSSRRTTRCAARSSRRWPTRPSCSRFAMLVLIGMIAFIVPVFVGVFKDFGGELPLITQVHRRALQRGHRPVVLPDRRRGRHRRRLPQVEDVRPGAARSGTRFRLRIPFKHRQDRPEDRARALVAHVLRALRRGRADHAGDRGDRPDRRQRRRRQGDGRRDRVRQVRRLDRRRRSRTRRSSRRWSRR